MTTALSVNLNKIALIRNSRKGDFPNVVEFGKKCIATGADGLTVHPRPDLRHIRPDDAYALKILTEQHANIELNIEGNPFAKSTTNYPGFCTLVKDIHPHQCTLVPDSTEQLTSDHGFDLTACASTLEPIIASLKQQGIRVSLFMDPDIAQIKLAKSIGADRIELYTGPYALAYKHQDAQFLKHLQRFTEAAQVATELGLGINAGHDLNLHNLEKFLQIPNVLEVSIGHALTVDALEMGFIKAVKAYRTICQASTS